MDHQKGTVRHSRAVLFSLRRFELHRPSFASAKGTDNFLFAKQIDKAQPCRISGGSPKETDTLLRVRFLFYLQCGDSNSIVHLLRQQNGNKLGFVGILTKRANCNASVKGDDSAPRCRGGLPRPPVDFDVTCPSVTRFALSLIHI